MHLALFQPVTLWPLAQGAARVVRDVFRETGGKTDAAKCRMQYWQQHVGSLGCQSSIAGAQAYVCWGSSCHLKDVAERGVVQ